MKTCAGGPQTYGPNRPDHTPIVYAADRCPMCALIQSTADQLRNVGHLRASFEEMAARCTKVAGWLKDAEVVKK